ncbi:MAG: BTAD domain-containing putative transcriptional regulator, partial [Bacteroidota bacterium]
MSQKTIVTLTDQPEKWASNQQNKGSDINFIITKSINLNTLNTYHKKTDLLIISQNKTAENILDIQSISASMGTPYTLLIPPERAEEFLNRDLTNITSSLFATAGPATDALPVRPSQAPLADMYLNGYLLGPFHILINGLLLGDFAGKKSKSLLAYLLYHNSRPSFRETLMDKFWPDVAPESARNSLNVAIHSIRRMFRKLAPQKELLVYKNERYFINPEIQVNLDHEDFLYRLKKGKRIELSSGIQDALSDFEEAARLYRGDFLEENLYDEWSVHERTTLREGYCYVLDRLSAHYCNAGKYKLAQHYCRKLLEKDNCREDIHRR